MGSAEPHTVLAPLSRAGGGGPGGEGSGGGLVEVPAVWVGPRGCAPSRVEAGLAEGSPAQRGSQDPHPKTREKRTDVARSISPSLTRKQRRRLYCSW